MAKGPGRLTERNKCQRRQRGKILTAQAGGKQERRGKEGRKRERDERKEGRKTGMIKGGRGKEDDNQS